VVSISVGKGMYTKTLSVSIIHQQDRIYGQLLIIVYMSQRCFTTNSKEMQMLL